jgi:phosphoglycerol transferase MdoB-like AlkP superfamily enzyme
MDMYTIFRSRFKGLLNLALIYIVVAFCTRTFLLTLSHADVQWGVVELLKMFALGFMYDVVSVAYFLIPFAFFSIVLTDNAFYSKWRSVVSHVFYIALSGLIVFGAVAEYFFWDEFGTRFNFIAIDYLIYTREVTHNIWESYNIPLVFSLIVALTALIAYLSIRFKWFKTEIKSESSLLKRFQLGVIFFVFPLFTFFGINQNIEPYFGNRYNAELSKNGVYSLGSAYINNELDYMKFYVSNDTTAVFGEMRKQLATANASFTSNNVTDLTRQITMQGETKPYNVILICDESLSASYLGCFGDTAHLTPNLDSLAKQSLFFTGLYATGTRTVRGMEAITLSTPPTPGSSLVRRPGNENLFSLGSVFAQQNYDVKFLYGGYGYFDNMNYFFGNNGFKIVDRSDFAKEEIDFANVWGICDEDVFERSLKEADKSVAEGKPFFQYIMTTSNHRPYTYPDGRIDIPSLTGRSGGIKYTDYAIGKLLREIKDKPWFKNTLVVVVADHCGNSAGKASIDIEKYHIPFFIYNPEIVKPQQVDLQCSQMDVAPTILGVLNMSYQSKFFGKNILTMQPEEQRAVMGTYQKLGYMKGNKVVLLDIQHRTEYFDYDRVKNILTPAPADPQLLNEVVAYYQSAYYMNLHKLNKK